MRMARAAYALGYGDNRGHKAPPNLPKTIPSPLRHAKVTTTLDLYSQSVATAKVEAQEDLALAITSTTVVD
jgi:hypothetical protein